MNCRITFLFLILLLIPNALLAAKREHHVIKAGDTPALLAKKYKVSYDEIVRFNNMKPELLTYPEGEMSGLGGK